MYIVLLIIFLILLNLYMFVNRKYKYIETDKNERKWVTKDEYDALVKKSGCMVPNFIDLTDLHYKSSNFLDNVLERSFQYRTERAAPKELVQQDLYNKLVPNLSKKRIYEIITLLSSLHTRYYTSDIGAIASEIIYNYIDSIKSNLCTVEYFNHTNSPKQRSVIAKIPGHDSPEESIIYCAHIDSINTKVSENERETARSPGADDNATGVANVLEVFRILCDTQPKKTLEFHFYAGEEQGLRGSAEIAEHYKLKDINVGGVLNNDMTGYTEDGKSAYIVNGENDYVDAELVDFCFELAKEYTYLELKGGHCGYACSDHASWGRYGYPSTCVSEATPKAGKLNPHNHSANDDITNISIDYTYQHARLGLGFMIEMGF